MFLGGGNIMPVQVDVSHLVVMGHGPVGLGLKAVSGDHTRSSDNRSMASMREEELKLLSPSSVLLLDLIFFRSGATTSSYFFPSSDLSVTF
jgi:hypothetical protein